MEQIPSEFWMIIISTVTIALIAIMYQIAMMLKDLRATVIGATEAINKSNRILEGVEAMVEQAQGVVGNVEEIIMRILSPFEMISDIMQFLAGLINMAPKEKETPEEEVVVKKTKKSKK